MCYPCFRPMRQTRSELLAAGDRPASSFNPAAPKASAISLQFGSHSSNPRDRFAFAIPTRAAKLELQVGRQVVDKRICPRAVMGADRVTLGARVGKKPRVIMGTNL